MIPALTRLIQIQSVLFLLTLITQGYATLFRPVSLLEQDNTSHFLSERVLADAYDICTKPNCTTQVDAGDTNYLSIVGQAQQDIFLNLGTNVEDLKLVYKASSANVDVTIMIVQAPASDYSDWADVNVPDQRSTSWTVTVPKSMIKAHQKQYLLFRMENRGTGLVNVELTMSYEETTPVLLIVLVATGCFAFLIVCVIGFLYFRLRRRQAIMEMEWRRRHGRQQQPDANSMTAKNLNDRFPSKHFEKIENSLGQTTCSVCLDEMQAGMMCRQLYCSHVFHSDCIKLWLINRIEKCQAVSCPNCNRDVSHLQDKFDVKEIAD